MTTTILVMFNLQDDASIDEYETWAQESDAPAVRNLPSVSEYRIQKATGLLMGDGDSPYKYVEIIEVEDMEQFGDDVETDRMQEISAQFQGSADDPKFVLTEDLA